MDQEFKANKNLDSDSVEGDGRKDEVDQRPPDFAASEGLGPWLIRNAPYLIGVLALFLWFCISQEFDPEKVFALVKVALGLGLVIFVHELGHFLIAKWCDVHVETFSIGFGPPIPGCMFRRGETTYMIALFPLGGYVKMVGEGPEEEHEDDPRSFKNKPVWQRMAIISAGVTMNLLLAFVCFVFVFLTHGAERAPGVVDRVEPGSPAWKKGMRGGDVIYWLGNKGPRPFFDDVRPVIMNSQKGEELKLVFGPPNVPEKDWTSTTIIARRDEDDPRPMIGILPPRELKLPQAKFRREHELPVKYQSAAAKANPPFEFGDSIIGTSDPANVEKVISLPHDPRCPEDPNHLDYFEFERRMRRLAGKEVIIQVRRQNSAQAVNIKVPPAFYSSLGLDMPMGKITAVRENSGAAKAGLKPDDIIEKIEMKCPDGRIIRYPGEIKDPYRLVYEMEKWAAVTKGPKLVTLLVAQANPLSTQAQPGNHPERNRVTLSVPFEEGWEFNNETPLGLSSPVSLPGLGIAYRIETTVMDVEPDFAAASARVTKGTTITCDEGDVIRKKDGSELRAQKGQEINLEEGDQISLKKGDVVKAVKFYESGKKESDAGKPTRWREIKSDQWAGVFESLQINEIKKLELRLERGNTVLEVVVTAGEDKTWLKSDRGLLLEQDRRLQKADNLGQALNMGIAVTFNFTSQIYGNLRAIISRRVSVDEVGGPITIGRLAFHIAGEDTYQFLLFLGIIGINLAVINFLPIPVLDGGHMAFLIYEWIRGKPAPEAVRVAATYVGLALIASLMIFVIYLDVKRLL